MIERKPFPRKYVVIGMFAAAVLAALFAYSC